MKKISILLMTILFLSFFQYWPHFPIYSLETDTVSAATSKPSPSPAPAPAPSPEPAAAWLSQPSSWAAQDIQKAGSYGLTVTGLMNQYKVFSDSAKIADWAADSIRYMNQIGVLNGTNDGKINPTVNTTREQAMMLVVRSYEAHAKMTDTVLPDAIPPDAVTSATPRQNGEVIESEDEEEYEDD